ncbi:hypothetical protein FJ938_09415 [Mesorhizobium sp. B2-4-14]|nr:hypothetical protein FJ548_23200 [Mesorhizobium sp. B2-4-17]TPL08456.1 hypothetical protein FJ938_09415 [Mesorhizobium sp. B2-4-14]
MRPNDIMACSKIDLRASAFRSVLGFTFLHWRRQPWRLSLITDQGSGGLTEPGPCVTHGPGLFKTRAMFYVCGMVRGRILSITKASGTPRS